MKTTTSIKYEIRFIASKGKETWQSCQCFYSFDLAKEFFSKFITTENQQSPSFHKITVITTDEELDKKEL